MKYIKVTLRIETEAGFIADVLTAYLGEAGFDSFEETSRGLNAYCPENLFTDDTLTEVIRETEETYGCRIAFRKETIEEQNWNATWEQNSFEPITLSDQIAIYPSSHKEEFTDKPYRHKIELNPVQSFGSGHHETTQMMLRYILEADIEGKRVLDMGCGTAVLAILARKRGATPVYAIDIDHWSTENAIQNAELNCMSDIEVVLGDASSIVQLGTRFDFILANINRNILTADMASYAAALTAGGKLTVSGFYTEDLPKIDDAAKAQGLSRIDTKTANNWAAAMYEKS